SWRRRYPKYRYGFSTWLRRSFRRHPEGCRLAPRHFGGDIAETSSGSNFVDADRTRGLLSQEPIEELTKNCVFSGVFLPSLHQSASIHSIEGLSLLPVGPIIPHTCTEQYPI